ncbi:hypothetical protein Pth03_49510 [Planotetraspora thailandica]|uniref:Uncharacterized protein n=1 Tax=Planotetraspora thailandica TaxID=487172 RepID=A0A8J3V6U4_9ACTN|nr:hypothetical protein Pth03_49510 [Planotetraspora thailandica]
MPEVPHRRADGPVVALDHHDGTAVAHGLDGVCETNDPGSDDDDVGVVGGSGEQRSTCHDK